MAGRGAQEDEYNYEGRSGVHKSIALCNKVHEEGVHVPPIPPPLDPLLVISLNQS